MDLVGAGSENGRGTTERSWVLPVMCCWSEFLGGRR